MSLDVALNFGDGLVVIAQLDDTPNSDGSYNITAAGGTAPGGLNITGLVPNEDGSDQKVWLNGQDGPNPVVDFGGITVSTDGTPNGAGGGAPSDINIFYSAGAYFEDTTPPTQIGNPTVTCFLAGTLIRTPDGEVAVETLKRGDLVSTSDGRHVPVAWVGKQTVSQRFADPLRVLPIRIRAGALGDNVPTRDLLLSADHALLVDGVLIQAGALVNGSSIARETRVPETFVYYHVETEDHSLILAEGATAETFIDNADRLGFDNWAEHQALYPEGREMQEMQYPRAKSHRQVPAQVRAKLDERAAMIFAADATLTAA